MRQRIRLTEEELHRIISFPKIKKRIAPFDVDYPFAMPYCSTFVQLYNPK